MSSRSGAGVTRLARIVGTVGIVAAFALAACGGVSVGSTYVGNADLGAFTKAPSEWKTEVVQTAPELSLIHI